jgi:hypothetical protein
MVEKLGSDQAQLATLGGGVISEDSATLLSGESTGSRSLLAGPALLREAQTFVANGDFAIPPADPTVAIDGDNGLPYFTTTDFSSGRIVATIEDSTLAVDQNILRFTMTNAVDDDYLIVERFIAVPTSEARTYGNQPRAAVVAATSSPNYYLYVAAQYYQEDATTTTGTVATNGIIGSTIATALASLTGAGVEYQVNPNGTGSAPADAAFLRVTVGVVATGDVASAELDISEIRIDRSTIQYLVADQTLPDLYGPAALYMNQGALILGNGGIVGSEPRIFMYATSGDIEINATDQGDTISLTSASRTASTVTIVTTSAHGFSSGYEVIVAGITGVPGTTMNGTIYPITVTNSTTFTYTAAGTAGSGTVTGATVKSGPGSGVIYLKPAATTLGRVQVDGRLKISGDNSLWVSRVSVASATQSLVNNTSTAVLFDTASTTPTTGTYDPNSWFSNANDWIEIGQDGFYAVTGNIAFAANATGRRTLSIIVNGADRGSVQVLASPAATTLLSISTSLYLASGDTVRLTCLQQSGGALSTVTVAGAYPALSVGRIGA